MSKKAQIIAKLSARFEPSRLEVIDESERHRGHAGWRAGGETHFRVRIAAPGLTGLSRIAQHRAITDALGDEFAGGLHALTIEVESSAV
jgi:BolA protein